MPVSTSSPTPWLRPVMTEGWFDHATSRADARMRVFLFPYAGGGSSLFRQWGRAFDADIDVLPVQLPGREGRLREPAIALLDQLADEVSEALLPLCDRPFVLFGWSMGARIAHAVARRCEATGQPPHLLIAAANSAPHLLYGRSHIHHLADEDFWRGLADLGGTPSEALSDPGLRELAGPMLRADFALIETAPISEPPSLACPVVAVAATADALVEMENVAAWQTATTGPFLLIRLAGGHFCLREDPSAAQAAVRQAIDWASRQTTDAAPRMRGMTLRDIASLMEF